MAAGTSAEARDAAPSTPSIGFDTMRTGDVIVVARSDLVDIVTALVARFGSLYTWASRQAQDAPLRGRAPVYLARLPESGLQCVVRHAWHGGLLAPLTRDLYRPPGRAREEVVRSAQLRELGIPASESLGYVLYPAPLGFCRVDTFSAYLSGTVDLGAIAEARSTRWSLQHAMSATMQLLAQLSAAHMVHPDLNARNVLLGSTGRSGADAAIGANNDGKIDAHIDADVETAVDADVAASGLPTAIVIDVDAIRHEPAMSERDVRHANAMRLLRSLRKLRRHSGLRDERELHPLIASANA